MQYGKKKLEELALEGNIYSNHNLSEAGIAS
jgi:hypothetical protein